MSASEVTPAFMSNFAGTWLLQENPRNLVVLSRASLVISETLQWVFTLLRISILESWPPRGHLSSHLKAAGLMKH